MGQIVPVFLGSTLTISSDTKPSRCHQPRGGTAVCSWVNSDELVEVLGPRGQHCCRQQSRDRRLDGKLPTGICCLALIVIRKFRVKFQTYGSFWKIRRPSHKDSGILHGNRWLELSRGAPGRQSTCSLSH